MAGKFYENSPLTGPHSPFSSSMCPSSNPPFLVSASSVVVNYSGPYASSMDEEQGIRVSGKCEKELEEGLSLYCISERLRPLTARGGLLTEMLLLRPNRMHFS